MATETAVILFASVIFVAVAIRSVFGGGSSQRPVSEARPVESEEQDPVRALLDQGQLIPAIKRYRQIHGCGLKEAKEAIDSMRAGGSPAPPLPPSFSEGMDRVRELMARGQKIPAIKLYRELHGCGLKEAKEAVERL